VVWCGVVWCGVVWCGVVWWCGMLHDATKGKVTCNPQKRLIMVVCAIRSTTQAKGV